MRIAIINSGLIVNAVEAAGPDHVTVPDGETAMAWDDALAAGYTIAVTLATAAQSPGPQRQFTFLQFMGLFTSAEQAAIVNATDTGVKLFLLMAAGASFIDLDDARTATGMDGLVALGLLTQERRDAIMAGQAPV